MSDLFPVKLFHRGFTPLVSVIPPSAKLSPNSRISAAVLGKVPGLRGPNGLWHGYRFLEREATLEDVERWAQAGSNFGILAEQFPALDIDCTDPFLSREIRRIAVTTLGPAPWRTGRQPRGLLMYRLEGEPFGRISATLRNRGRAAITDTHLVEMLGAGRQYLIHGMHPSGSPYEWNESLLDIGPEGLTTVTREQVEAFFDELEAYFEEADMLDIVVERNKTVSGTRTTTDQEGLRAPSLQALEALVSKLPNEQHDREHYLKVGYAIKAAGAEDEDAALQLFLRWCETWSAKTPDLDESARDWRRFHPPYSVGWTWLAAEARPFGFNDAIYEFDPIAPADGAERSEEPAPPELSDVWLAARVVTDHGHALRYVPGWGSWLVFDGSRWMRDAVKAAERRILMVLTRLADRYVRSGATGAEKVQNMRIAKKLCAAGTMANVRTLVEADGSIAVAPEHFDGNPWVLNTPGGLFDLKTGEARPVSPDDLCTRITRVTPNRGAACPAWMKFLRESTGGDDEVVDYLQRICGYCLTGSTREQSLFFIWGPGGNGKSVFINTVSQILGGYADTAPMDTFTASTYDRHPTDLAGLAGSRMVFASETQAGRRWDEAKIKLLTGGDPVKARFMRQDFFTFLPQFKLLFVGNHKPEIRSVDDGMRRRIHIIPFVNKPTVVDPDLAEKLRSEWPAILGWMVDGCLKWQRDGLEQPEAIEAATEQYFSDEDAMGRFLSEVAEEDPEGFVTTLDLFDRWREWANRSNEYVGTVRKFSQSCVTHGLVRGREPKTRRMGFVGLKIIPNAEWSE